LFTHRVENVPIVADSFSTEFTSGASVGRVNVTLMTSPFVTPGTLGGGFDAMADTTPGQHSMAPSSLPSSDAQPEHAVDAGNELNVLAGHAAQSDGEAAPVTLLYRPAGHARCAPPGQ
jgi:hypothetical protein